MNLEHFIVSESKALKKQSNESMSKGHRSQLLELPMAKAATI